MRRLLPAILLACSLTAAQGQETVEIPRTLYEELLVHLRRLRDIEHAVPSLTLSKIEIVRDKSARLFLPEEISAHITLSYLQYEVRIPLQVEVVRKVEKKSFLTLRYKIGMYGDPSRKLGTLSAGGALLFEPFAFGILGVNLYAGSGSAGGALSISVTRNLDVFAGGGFHYSDRSPAGVFGLSLSLN